MLVVVVVLIVVLVVVVLIVVVLYLPDNRPPGRRHSLRGPPKLAKLAVAGVAATGAHRSRI